MTGGGNGVSLVPAAISSLRSACGLTASYFACIQPFAISEQVRTTAL
jgi:hypothetical protein